MLAPARESTHAARLARRETGSYNAYTVRTALLVPLLAAAVQAQSAMTPKWEIGYEDRVELVVTCYTLPRTITDARRTWTYVEKYVDVVKEVADGRPTLIKRYYESHECSPSLRLSAKKRAKEIEKRNPPLEGKTLQLAVKGRKLTPRGRVGRDVRKFITRSTTFACWEALLGKEPAKTWKVGGPPLSALLPVDFLGKARASGRMSRFSRVTETHDLPSMRQPRAHGALGGVIFCPSRFPCRTKAVPAMPASGPGLDTKNQPRAQKHGSLPPRATVLQHPD